MSAHEPWAAFGDWTDVPLGPALYHPVQRAEAQARADARREAAEREERAEARRNASLVLAHQYALARGEAWNPSDPWATWPTTEQFIDAAFARQDVQARRAEFQAAREAGLVHLLSVSPADMAAGELVLESKESVAERSEEAVAKRFERRSHLAYIRDRARRALAYTGRPKR